MSAFIDSPVWGAVISVVGTALSGIVVLIARLMSKVNKIEGAIEEIAKDIGELKDDKDIMRWSEVGREKVRRKRRVW